MSRIRVYVAGPMTKGDFMLNVRKAVDASQELRERGMFPYMPQMSTLWHFVYARDYEDWMDQDFEWLAQCHALLRIPGESSGAEREIVFAKDKGIPVFHSIEALTDWAREFQKEIA